MNNKLCFNTNADNNVIFGVIALYNSILDNYKVDEFDFIIGVSEDFNIDFFAKNISTTENISFVKMDDIFGGLLNELPKIDGRITKLAFGRFFLKDIVTNASQYKSIIYLDADIILMNRIENKIINAKNNIAMFPENSNEKIENTINWIKSQIKNDEFSNELKKKIENETYFQSGVIFINNLEKYNRLMKKCIKFIEEQDQIFDDQNIINLLNDKNEIEVVKNSKYNYRPGFQDEVIEEPILVHFAGSKKPWKRFAYNKYYSNILWQIKKYYFRESNWGSEVRIDLTNVDIDDIKPILQIINEKNPITLSFLIDNKNNQQSKILNKILQTTNLLHYLNVEIYNKHSKIVDDFNPILKCYFIAKNKSKYYQRNIWTFNEFIKI